MARTQISKIERKEVGKVTVAERDEIKGLFERKNGIAELFRCLTASGNQEVSGNDLYERLVKDMGETATKFQQWWDASSKKYNWENVEGCKWEIDFDACVVYLTKK